MKRRGKSQNTQLREKHGAIIFILLCGRPSLLTLQLVCCLVLLCPLRRLILDHPLRCCLILLCPVRRLVFLCPVCHLVLLFPVCRLIFLCLVCRLVFLCLVCHLLHSRFVVSSFARAVVSSYTCFDVLFYARSSSNMSYIFSSQNIQTSLIR